MNFGHSAAVRFEANRNAAAAGIYWSKEKSKQDKRKFGYKTKNLRHAIRQTDNEDLIAEIQATKELESRKFNKENKDFIQKNRARYKAAPQGDVANKDSTQIKPGTVTLTQAQLAALLSTLGAKTDSGGNPLRISVDSKTNQIQVEKYESDDDAEVELDNRNDDDDDDDGGDSNIYNLLNGGEKKSHSKKEKPTRKELDETRKPQQPKRGERKGEHQVRFAEDPSPSEPVRNEMRSSLEQAKKEAGVGHVSPLVPWKHLTVGERKRLQWAMERAEMAKEYDPWGRPGAGAPVSKAEDAQPEVPANRQDSRQHHQVQQQPQTASVKQQQGYGEQEDLSHLSKKEIDRRKWLAELDKQREEQRMRKQMEKQQNRTDVHDKWADRFVYHKTIDDISPRSAKHQTSIRTQEPPPQARRQEEAEPVYAPPVAMRSSMVVGAGTLNENRYTNRKDGEKRQWLEELERQRDEQRRAKVEAKQRDKQEDGYWVDRYPTDQHKLTQFARGGDAPPPSKAEARERDKQEDGYWADRYPTDQHKLTQFARGGDALPPSKPDTQSPRTSSAPQPPPSHHASVPMSDPRASQEEPTTFIRGQGVYVDPVTRKEQEEKRRLHMEYQAQIKAQIEEKERLKREERQRKVREDVEEERKLQKERDMMKRQTEVEQKKQLDKEEVRQRQIAVLNSAINQAQEKAQEEKTVKRMQHLQEGGHDVTQLKAAYQASSPRNRVYEATSIPGLGNPSNSQEVPNLGEGRYEQTHRMPEQHQAKEKIPLGQSYTKEAYVEDRVLTPSRFRNPALPRDNPDSPKREFGTQTLELKDLQAILNSLPDEVQIEYKLKVEEALKQKREGPIRKKAEKNAEESRPPKGRKVVPMKTETKSAEVKTRKQPPTVKEKEKPAKFGERPAWGQRQRKTAVKNSERDPFYQQRREEAEARKVKRERQLQYLQELNKESIPTHGETRTRDASMDRSKRGAARGGLAEEESERPGKGNRVNRQRDPSPNILSLMNDNEAGGVSAGRQSPPIPTVRHRTRHQEPPENDPYSYTNNVLRSSQTENRYGDSAVGMAAPMTDGEFVPFMRTAEILDPARADDPMAISRENSRMEKARRAYLDTRAPANQGRKMNLYQDREREAAMKASQDPITNPNLVTDHPTARQDRILQQLSSLKQTLMQRQKELETYMSPSELEVDKGATIKAQ